MCAKRGLTTLSPTHNTFNRPKSAWSGQSGLSPFCASSDNTRMPMDLPDALIAANREFARTHPGESGRRQPVHMMVGGAHLFKRDVSQHMGKLAQRALADYAPDPATL